MFSHSVHSSEGDQFGSHLHRLDNSCVVFIDGNTRLCLYYNIKHRDVANG